MQSHDKREDSSINIPGYGQLPFVDKNPRNFFRRTTILYGPSETGKTFIGQWIMEILQPYIPNIIVICPTEGSQETWKDKVPPRCIKTKIDVKDLKDILDRQIEATAIYNKANRLPILKQLFMKANDLTAVTTAARIERMGQAKLAEVKRSFSLNFAQKKEQTAAIEKNLTSVVRRMYKSTIKSYKEQLHGLSIDEQYALKYLDFNPSLLLILDDCQAQIAIWGKDDTVNQLFFQGRHSWVTSMYMMQSDSGKGGLPPGIRSNTFNNFFTTAEVANHFFRNEQNAFTPLMKKQSQKIVDEMFKENGSGVENFKKFCYSRLDKTAKFRYVVADTPENLKFGSPALWKLSEGCPTNTKVNLAPSKFSRSFGI